MKWSAGVLPLMTLILLLIAQNVGRQVFSRERPPAVSLVDHDLIRVELGQGFARPVVYQFSDGQLWEGVISLTNLECAENYSNELPDPAVLGAGIKLDFSCNEANSLEISRTWMNAARRMALGIPLHPDRMTLADWQVLPGIGPRLAERIEDDRQKNGYFSSLEALRRVSGIGPKRIDDWRGYFSSL